MTPVNLCNMALHRIGAAPISNLETDKTKSAVACQALYEQTRDALLRAHDWAFACEVQELTSETDDGLTVFEYKYTLPADPWCLKVRHLLDDEMGDGNYPYKLMGRAIYTDLEDAYLEYTRRVEDPDDWDVLFTEALAWRLAAELIRPLGNKSGVDADQKYADAMLDAKGADAQEKQEKKTPPTKWGDARFGG